MGNPLLRAASGSGSTDRLYQYYTVKCSKCGKEFNFILSPKEIKQLNNGKSLKEIFEHKSPILRAQAFNELCDSCYIKYYKEASHGSNT